eukprot:scaffold1498_cov314-Prasinococcus_capsulatus_cf.AAC.7
MKPWWAGLPLRPSPPIFHSTTGLSFVAEIETQRSSRCSGESHVVRAHFVRPCNAIMFGRLELVISLPYRNASVHPAISSYSLIFIQIWQCLSEKMGNKAHQSP